MQDLALFGMQRIVFPCHHFPSKPSIRMQTLIDTVSFVHTKPWLLPEMDAGLLFLYVSPLCPGLFISCGLPVCCHAHGGRGAAIKPLRPTPRTCAWIANTQATHRLMNSPGKMYLPLEYWLSRQFGFHFATSIFFLLFLEARIYYRF